MKLFTASLSEVVQTSMSKTDSFAGNSNLFVCQMFLRLSCLSVFTKYVKVVFLSVFSLCQTYSSDNVIQCLPFLIREGAKQS